MIIWFLDRITSTKFSVHSRWKRYRPWSKSTPEFNSANNMSPSSRTNWNVANRAPYLLEKRSRGRNLAHCLWAINRIFRQQGLNYENRKDFTTPLYTLNPFLPRLQYIDHSSWTEGMAQELFNSGTSTFYRNTHAITRTHIFVHTAHLDLHKNSEKSSFWIACVHRVMRGKMYWNFGKVMSDAWIFIFSAPDFHCQIYDEYDFTQHVRLRPRKETLGLWALTSPVQNIWSIHHLWVRGDFAFERWTRPPITSEQGANTSNKIYAHLFPRINSLIITSQKNARSTVHTQLE